MSVQGLRLNLAGLNALMTSNAAQDVVDREGKQLAAKAGPDFEYVRRGHKWVARGFVQAANPRGMREQARNAALERAIGSR